MTERPRGRCVRCQREMSLRLDGTLAMHGARTMYHSPCAGSHEWPVHGSVNRGPRSELVRRPHQPTVTVPRACLDLPLVGASLRAGFIESC